MGAFARVARAALSCGGKDNGSDHADSSGKRLQHGAQSRVGRRTSPSAQMVLLKIYPPVGQTADDGHNLPYLAIPQWEHDVFGFLDEHVNVNRVSACEARDWVVSFSGRCCNQLGQVLKIVAFGKSRRFSTSDNAAVHCLVRAGDVRCCNPLQVES